MTALGRPRACGFCGKGIKHKGAAGRPRDYCDAQCRRRAQRERDRSRQQDAVASTLPSGAAVARSLHLLVLHLQTAEDHFQPLKYRLAIADQITNATRCYVGAAVHGARLAGASWQDIGAESGSSEASARARWNATRLTRDLAGPRVSPEGELAAKGRSAPGETVRQTNLQSLIRPQALAEALSALRARSGITVHHAAQQADLTPGEICQILDGDHLPSWPVTHMLTTILAGNPQETRVVWEAAHGLRHTSRLSPRDAGKKLQRALRGLHLAAGCPSAEAVGRSAGLPAGLVSGILSGSHLPDWPTTASLASGLAADPEVIRSLWENLDYARIVSSDQAAADAGPACGAGAREQ